MIIEESDYVLESSGGSLFDLKLLNTKKKKDGTVVEEFGDPIYGCSLLSALKRIIGHRLRHKNRNGAITIAKYRNDIIAEMKFLHDIFDGTPEEKDDGLE